MQKTKKVAYAVGSKEEREIREGLQQMACNGSYNTPSSYTPSSLTYPDGLISFVDRHMRYLKTHPQVDVRMYIANLRLMTRITL